MRLPCELFNEAAPIPPALPTTAEATMNIFKGLLFMHGHVNPASVDDFIGDQARLHYGASTAADEVAPPLGNRAASQSWLRLDPAPANRFPEAGCIAGGCG